MARNGDLSIFLSKMKNKNPVNSIIATSAIVLALVPTGGLVQIAALTSLTILFYYAATNICALRLHDDKRLFPKAISIVGFISCLGLAMFLPQEQWMWMMLLLAPGIIYMLIRKI